MQRLGLSKLSRSSSLQHRRLNSSLLTLIVVLTSFAGIATFLYFPSPITAILLIAALSGIAFQAYRDWHVFQAVRRAYDMAMLAAHDGFWEWDPITKALHVGPRLLEILGYREDFLPDTHAWLKLVHPDDVGSYNRAVADHLKGNSAFFTANTAFWRTMAITAGLLRVAWRFVTVPGRPTRWSARSPTLPKCGRIRRN